MRRKEIPRIMGIGGVFTAIATILQASPVFLPAAGLLLSPFSTLPIALAACSSAYTGLISLLSAFMILFFISPQEAAIFILSTGPLGLVIGLLSRKGFIRSALVSAAALCAGICILVHVLGIAAFGGMTPESLTFKSLCVFFLFSLGYSCVWTYLLKLFKKLLKKAGFE